MKLVFCTYCRDLFRLHMHTETCLCGRVKGRYLNETDAIVTKEAISIGLDNRVFFPAISADPETRRDLVAWIRPNEGQLNPHTEVVAAEDWRWGL
jgi:hypothetical protein